MPKGRGDYARGGLVALLLMGIAVVAYGQLSSTQDHKSIALEVRPYNALPGAEILPPSMPQQQTAESGSAPAPLEPGRAKLAAALEGGNRLAVTTFGSSSNPTIPVRLVVRDAHTLDLYLAARGSEDSTLDVAPTTSVVALDPGQIDLSAPITLRLRGADSSDHEDPFIVLVVGQEGGPTSS